MIGFCEENTEKRDATILAPRLWFQLLLATELVVEGNGLSAFSFDGI